MLFVSCSKARNEQKVYKLYKATVCKQRNEHKTFNLLFKSKTNKSIKFSLFYKREKENSDMKTVKIFTDGACSGNPGPGGYGAILQYGSHIMEISGGAAQTTNNRMELSAVIEALTLLKEPCKVILTTDSKYVADSVSKGWVYGWQKKNWIRSAKDPVPNTDLWKLLLPLLAKHEVEFVWVKGHAGHPENERCDELAVIRRDEFSKQ